MTQPDGPTCVFCGCSEHAPCAGGCGWLRQFNGPGRVCTACAGSLALAMAMNAADGVIALFSGLRDGGINPQTIHDQLIQLRTLYDELDELGLVPPRDDLHERLAALGGYESMSATISPPAEPRLWRPGDPLSH